MIERHKKLLRNYTQNIDTLERAAGIENVIECHGRYFNYLYFFNFNTNPCVLLTDVILLQVRLLLLVVLFVIIRCPLTKLKIQSLNRTFPIVPSVCLQINQV